MTILPDHHRNGGLAVVATLAAHGVDTIFGIPGTHNLELYRHLHHYGIRAVTPRHEQGAGYAADGYFLLSGRPGVVITTSGPGLTNVITAAATAYAESRPMLILSPGVPTGMEGADAGLLHETKDSSGALSRLLVASRRARTAEGAAQAVAEAFALFASSRPGPVHIEVPLDVLEGPWWGTAPQPLAPQPPVPTADTVARAAELLRTADRPLIVAGGGSRHAADRLTALAERLDAPVATTCNGKGVLDEAHPLSLGSNVRFGAVQEASRAADVLVVLGTELADSDLWGGTVGAQNAPGTAAGSATPGPAGSADGLTVDSALDVRAPRPDGQQVIRCDIDPDQLNKNLIGDVLVHSDTGAFLDALLAALGEDAGHGGGSGLGSRPDSGSEAGSDPEPVGTSAGRHRAESLRAACAEEFDGAGLNARITRAVAAAGGPGVVIGGDSSQVTYDGTVHALEAHTPDQLLYMPGFATLGYGIPAALGAKVAAPERPVAALLGDGAAMFSVQEVMTAVELGLPIPFVVVDNGGYAEIEDQMTARDMPPFAVRLDRPDFAALGRSMGAHGVTVALPTGAGEAGALAEFDATLRGAVADAFAAGRPTVVHVIAPRRAPSADA